MEVIQIIAAVVFIRVGHDNLKAEHFGAVFTFKMYLEILGFLFP
jgi:hypothetical protein